MVETVFTKEKLLTLIVNYVKELGGIITHEDLVKYKAVWRKPIEFDYKGYKITSMTLPASGGVCLAQILKSVEPYDFSKIEHNSTKYFTVTYRSRTQIVCRQSALFRRYRFCQCSY